MEKGIEKESETQSSLCSCISLLIVDRPLQYYGTKKVKLILLQYGILRMIDSKIIGNGILI